MDSTLVNNADLTKIQNVLFVDSAVQGDLQQYSNPTTFAIGYNASTSSDEVLQLLRSVFPSSSFTRVGFAFHYTGSNTSTPFMNNENLFPDPLSSDLEKLKYTDNKNVIFMLSFIREFSIGHIDFLACNTLQSDTWRQYYQFLLAQTGVIVGASDNETGNIKYGGDWVMESDMEDISTIYFTSAIINYSQLLTISYSAPLNTYIHTFYTVLPETPTVMTRKIYNNVGNVLDTTDISYGENTKILDFLSIMDSSGTNPYGIGVVDASGGKITMDLAYSNIYTFPLSGDQQNQVMSYVNKTYLEPHAYMDGVYTVTVNGNIWLATPGTSPIEQPALNLTAGCIYYFDQGDTTNYGNSLYFSTTLKTYIGYYETGVTKYTLQPEGIGSVNSYTTVSPTSNITLFCNKTKSFAEITSEALSYYSCRYGSVTTLNGNVIVWNNKNRGIGCVDASAIFVGTSNTEAAYPTLVPAYPMSGISMIKMSNSSPPSKNFGFNILGGMYRTGQLYEQTLFYFGYTRGYNENGTSSLLCHSGTVNPAVSKIHLHYYNKNLSLYNPSNILIDVSAQPIPGYVMCSITLISDGVSTGSSKGTSTFTKANFRKFPTTYGNSNTMKTVSSGGLNSETFNNFNIGYWDNEQSRNLFGEIGEVMYFNRVLTLPERQIIEGKIAWEYGIASVLFDSTHPYYSAPPS